VGPGCRQPRGKKKKRRRHAPLREGLGGPLGRKGGKVLFPFFFFFFKHISNQTISTQIQIKSFQTFSQDFINLLDLTQATKNQA
jgi:hypothetical protein